MKVLIACEFSGVVREAFREYGHEAVSCDLEPSEMEGPHVQGDVMEILRDGWDLMVAHPPCTYLCNSGVRWLHERPQRWEYLDRAARFFRALLDAPIPRICVENPIPHKYAIERIGRSYDQIVQPWWFGDPIKKATCLWLDGLPELEPTNIVKNPEPTIHRMAPGPQRKRERSRFFPGFAEAMAKAWG